MSGKSVFAKNVEYFLNVNDKTRAELYKAVGVDKSTASRWFNNGTIPELKTIDKIADFLDVPKSMLLEEYNPEKQYAEEICFKIKNMGFSREQLNELYNFAKIINERGFDEKTIEKISKIAEML